MSLTHRLLAEASERIEELDDVIDTPVGAHFVSGRQRLAEMLDTPAPTVALVANHRETLQRVSGRTTTRGIVRWVDTVRPVLLAELAEDMDYAAGTQGAIGGYAVVDDRFVDNSLRITPAPASTACAVSAPAARARRSRPRARRRSTSTRRSRSPGRPSDDEHHPARHVGPRGVGAAS
ncbi:hypothetical protein [Gaiella sp.]|uniref:hypothetical protein n=1 Tax=Gaiella sp. TaxID=2663207 RepID=UPI002E359909|nr:hypothetical protein [Gaiella sp.]HEX5582517.1 hypothetical protein [Gaiella sp.]